MPGSDAGEEGRLVQQGMADAAVAPVEQRQPAGRAAEIARVAIGIERACTAICRSATSAELARQIGDEGGRAARHRRRGDTPRDAIEQRWLSPQFRRARARSGNPIALLGRPDTGRHRRDACMATGQRDRGGLEQLQQRRLVRVLAPGRSSRQRPAAMVPERWWRRPRCQGCENAALMSEERQHHLQPRRCCPATGMRQTLDRFQLRICTGAPASAMPCLSRTDAAQARSSAGPPGSA